MHREMSYNVVIENELSESLPYVILYFPTKVLYRQVNVGSR